jgi:hypothetical protein
MKFELNVPTNLNEITLGQYQKFLVTKEGSNDEEFVAQKMVEIFCGIELKEIAKMKFTDLNDLILHFTKIFDVKPKFQPTFKIGTQEFGFITSLEDISFGEYVDLENNLLKWETYHKAMAVMYRPITLKFKNQYKISDYEPNKEMQELMKFAPVDIAIGSSVFFWNLGSDLLQSSLSYLENQMLKNPKMAESLMKELNLQSIGDGTNPFTQLHKETFQDLKQLPNINLLNVLPILPSKNKSKKLSKEK